MDTIIKTKDSVVLTTEMVNLVSDLSRGKTVKEVAAKTKQNRRTLEARINSMKDKYRCTTIAHLVANFLRLGIIK